MGVEQKKVTSQMLDEQRKNVKHARVIYSNSQNGLDFAKLMKELNKYKEMVKLYLSQCQAKLF